MIDHENDSSEVSKQDKIKSISSSSIRSNSYSLNFSSISRLVSKEGSEFSNPDFFSKQNSLPVKIEEKIRKKQNDRIYVYKHESYNRINRRSLPRRLARMIHWAVFLGNQQIVENWMRDYHINPFHISRIGFNGLHLIAQFHLFNQNHKSIVKWLLRLQLYLIEVDGLQGRRMRDTTIDIIDLISIRSKPHLNTVLHYCCISKNYQIFETILDFLDERTKDTGERVDILEVNLRGWTYHQMNSRGLNIFEQRILKSQQVLKNFEKNDANNSSYGLDSSQSHIFQKQALINNKEIKKKKKKKKKNPLNIILKQNDLPYQYCIIEILNKNREVDSITSLEYELKKVKDKYIKKVKNLENITDSSNIDDKQLSTYSFNYTKYKCNNIKIIDPMIINKYYFWKSSKNSEGCHFQIYLLSVGRGVMKDHAISTGMKVYDHIHHFTTRYDERVRQNYEKFRTVEKSEVLNNILSSEMELESFKENGQILDYFPIHHFDNRRYINKYWKDYALSCLFYPIHPFKYNAVALVPIIQIGFYHGIQNAFFIQFLIFMTVWVLLLVPVGLILTIWIWFKPNHEHFQTMISLFVLILWQLFFMKQWQKMENALSFLFGTQKSDISKHPVREYWGIYVIHQLSKCIEMKDTRSNTMKRLYFSDTIFLFLGVFCLIQSYLLYLWLESMIGYYSILINVVINFLITKVYFYLVNRLVLWENQKHITEKQDSIRYKRVIFEIFSSNITLFSILLSSYTKRFHEMIRSDDLFDENEGNFWNNIQSIVITTIVTQSALSLLQVNKILFNLQNVFLPLFIYKISKRRLKSRLLTYKSEIINLNKSVSLY